MNIIEKLNTLKFNTFMKFVIFKNKYLHTIFL